MLDTFEELSQIKTNRNLPASIWVLIFDGKVPCFEILLAGRNDHQSKKSRRQMCWSIESERERLGHGLTANVALTMERDEDLKSLYRDPRFIALVSRTKKNDGVTPKAN
jgi:hypothetical protein